jgi:hypothetical protein
LGIDYVDNKSTSGCIKDKKGVNVQEDIRTEEHDGVDGNGDWVFL